MCGSDYVKEWGRTRFEVYNKHPDDRGRLGFPIVNVMADNSDGYFSPGGTIFPNGRDDFYSTTLRVEMTAHFADGTQYKFLDFYGQVREPEYDETETVNLVAEHPLTAASGRIWDKQDRIGGDTGIDANFNG
jgi:hypothetical protein